MTTKYKLTSPIQVSFDDGKTWDEAQTVNLNALIHAQQQALMCRVKPIKLECIEYE